MDEGTEKGVRIKPGSVTILEGAVFTLMAVPDVVEKFREYSYEWTIEPEANGPILARTEKNLSYWKTDDAKDGVYLVTVEQTARFKDEEKVNEPIGEKKVNGPIKGSDTISVTLLPNIKKNLDEKLDKIAIDGETKNVIVESIKEIADKMSDKETKDKISGSIDNIANRLPAPGRPSPVALSRTTEDPTSDLVLWAIIERATKANKFCEYRSHIDKKLQQFKNRKDIWNVKSLFFGANAYRELRDQTDEFLLENCPTLWNVDKILEEIRKKFKNDAPTKEQVKTFVDTYPGGGPTRFPHLLQAVGNLSQEVCSEVQPERACSPVLLELIWSYWHEEGMLVQTLNAIGLRFQNKSRTMGKDPLAHMDIDPLRPLNNIFWGYLQDENNRLTTVRRAYEYDHHYGLTLYGKAVPKLQSADSRSKFLEAFHSLLHLCTVYFKELDDTTIYADAFPLLNALRDVHLLLLEGSHNQYGDLPWTSRAEMLMQQWLLARPEIRDFLGGRPMVTYQEDWMGRVDTMKKLQGWTDVSVTHFHNLAVWGEQILLSIRFGNWNNNEIVAANAANWAGYWRNEIQGYIHAYRTVTGVNLSNPNKIDFTRPSVHLRRRLALQKQGR